MTSEVIMAKTKAMIDDLKTVCANYGLGNASSEYKIITEVFLYKFLNDKFLHEIRKVDDKLQNVEISKKHLQIWMMMSMSFFWQVCLRQQHS